MTETRTIDEIDTDRMDCGDSGCILTDDHSGMRTNGGCRCVDERKARRRILGLLRERDAVWRALGTIGRGRGVTIVERAAKVVASRDAIHEAAGLPTWSAMDTAPRDGTRVLLSVSGRVHVGQWDADECARKPRPLWRYSYLHGANEQRSKPPTHWMPLPEPPTGESR